MSGSLDSVLSGADEERYRRFGDELDALRERAAARVGPDDVRYIRGVDRFSRAMEAVGRALIWWSPEPVSFLVGVGALFLHKQIQAVEIGHTVLHGTFDRLPGAEAFRSRTFRWDTPIDEESWRYTHNVLHHANTNLAGKDPDLRFGQVRLTEQTPWRPEHRIQLGVTLGLIFPNLLFFIAQQVSGVNDVLYSRYRRGEVDVLPDRSRRSARGAWSRLLRKYVPYYLYNYVLWPALAGAMFWKVLLGNWLADTLRDICCAAIIFCGHVGADVASFRADAPARSRGHWYAMQIEASQDCVVGWPVSVLTGGLELHIEHHLFPRLPPRRLREIIPEVRGLCEKYGVDYKADTWARTLSGALSHIGALAHREGRAPH